MKKTYTLFYSINDFNNEECQIIDTEELSSDYKEFDEVFQLLDNLMIEPPQHLVDSLIDYAVNIGK